MSNRVCDEKGNILNVGDTVICDLLKYHNPYVIVSIKSNDIALNHHIYIRPKNEDPEISQRYLVHPSKVYKVND